MPYLKDAFLSPSGDSIMLVFADGVETTIPAAKLYPKPFKLVADRRKPKRKEPLPYSPVKVFYGEYRRAMSVAPPPLTKFEVAQLGITARTVAGEGEFRTLVRDFLMSTGPGESQSPKHLLGFRWQQKLSDVALREELMETPF